MLLPAEGLVLAGGRSRRFGGDKALARVGGRTLLEWALWSLEGVFGTVRLAGQGRTAYDFVGVRQIPDLRPEAGPLAAIAAALARGRPIAVLAVDLFPVRREIWWRLWQAAQVRAAAAAVIGGRAQPLLAIYGPEAAEAAAAELAGRRRVEAVLTAVDAEAVPLPEAWAPVNVNTPADLELAMRRWASGA